MAKIDTRQKQQYRPDPLTDYYQSDPMFPKNIMIELSNACNHKCIFCTNTYMQRKISRISPNLIQKIMEDARQAGTREIGFYTTGEPFVHKDLEKFTSSAKELGYEYIYISTNGGVATKERIKAVIDAGMDSIKFSINAGSKETYTQVHGRDDWDKVVENVKFTSELRKTLDRPLYLAVSCVVTDIVRHEKKRLEETFESLVDEVIFYDVFNQSGQMNATLSLLSNIPARNDGQTPICAMPFNRLHVTCEGYLTLCCTDYQNYLAVANLNEMPIVDAWSSEPFKAARRRHLENDLKGTLCGNCWLERTDAIEPLDDKLAAHIDFDQLREETVNKTRERMS
jgi:organic radical activating enzyme